ncbi:hypothetical protein JZ751_017277 [Albula glossodonta]|uniref:Uncharacterized protein n=1 Tax=Albula glossodonta TaxID=121402 RepID=A0A8T2MUM3_9TELE|nr:hypothetical protein JZ751_017277 [Albula glossodonta]
MRLKTAQGTTQRVAADMEERGRERERAQRRRGGERCGDLDGILLCARGTNIIPSTLVHYFCSPRPSCQRHGRMGIIEPLCWAESRPVFLWDITAALGCGAELLQGTGSAVSP